MMLALVRDISGRREAEEKIRETEARYRTLVEQIPAVTYIQEPIESENPKAITYMSPQYEAMLGYPANAEMVDEEHWLKTLHPEDRERVLAEEVRTDETGEPYRVEYRLIARDGSVVWVHDEAELVRDGEGEPLYWLGVQYDITERKRTEEELRRSEERFRATFEQAAVGILQVGLDGGWLEVQRQVLRHHGLRARGARGGERLQPHLPRGLRQGLRARRQHAGRGAQGVHRGEAHHRQGRKEGLDQPDRLPGLRFRRRAPLLYRGRRGHRETQARPRRSSGRARSSTGA